MPDNPFMLMVGDGNCCGLACDQTICVTVKDRCNVPAPYVPGVPVTIKNQAGSTVATGTTDAHGTFCWDAPRVTGIAPDLYWISIDKGACRGDTPTQEVAITCGYQCTPSLACAALHTIPGVADDRDLASIGGNIVDSQGIHPLVYDYVHNYFTSGTASFTATGFQDSYIDHACTGLSTWTIPYYYRVSCTGSTITCQIVTNPIRVCTYDSEICGYYLGDYYYDDDPAQVVVFTDTATPTTLAGLLVANFAFTPNETCASTNPPPSPAASIAIPIIGAYRVACGTPCPIPRQNLTLHWTRVTPAGSGDVTLIYSPAGYWSATGYAFNPYTGLMIVGYDEIPVLDTYTCIPFYYKYKAFDGTIYEIHT